ncbi:MAG: hypothetical protein AAGA90_08640 [Actinomycetota bacterium]
MEQVGEAQLSEATAGTPVGRRISIGAAVLALGATLALAAGPVAEFVEFLLPTRGEVSSRGTAFRSYTDVGEQVVRRTGVIVALAAATFLVVDRVAWRPRPVDRRVGHVALVVAMAVGAGWYGWLGDPHNGFPTNARIHWVDFESSRVDDFFYAAGRLPHWLFYETPYVWQGINAAVVVGLAYAIGRRLELSVVASLAMAVTPLIATNLLLFADTAEDVLLNTALLLFVCWASLRRDPVILGVALVAAVLGRPSFIVLGACVAAAEGLAVLRQTRSPRAALSVLFGRYVVTAGVVTVVGIVMSQALFEILGDRYLFVDGTVIDTGPLSSAEPVEVEGFTISAFSGAYLAHLVWVMPLVFLIGAVIAVRRAPSLPEPIERSVYFGAVAVVALLVVHESQPLLYYNVRYLTYVWPFLFVLAWAGYGSLRVANGRQAIRAAVLVALLAGSMAIPADPVGLKRTLEARPDVELADVRDDLRELTEDKVIALTFGSRSTRNFVSYVIRSSERPIHSGADAADVGWVVISMRDEPWRDRAPDLETPSLVVHVVREADVAG